MLTIAPGCGILIYMTKTVEKGTFSMSNVDQKYEALFTPWNIGNVEIKNRIVMCPMGGNVPVRVVRTDRVSL